MAGQNRLASLVALKNSPEEVSSKTNGIFRGLLASTPHFKSANFEAIAADDLSRLFALYDAGFFGGLLERMLREDGAFPMGFRLSSRMTSSGGTTLRIRPRNPGGKTQYEITISTVLLFQTFAEVDRPIKVTGLICSNRLEALQRIFEHELLHLAEFLATERSNCKGSLFKSLAMSIFGHQAVVHELVTPREVAATTHAIRIGDIVSFEFDGKTHVGRVNRITRRASVLVDDPAGPLFSNGGRYRTFYVPLDLLRKPG